MKADPEHQTGGDIEEHVARVEEAALAIALARGVTEEAALTVGEQRAEVGVGGRFGEAGIEAALISHHTHRQHHER